ncbi:hypothetical protein P8R96_05030 [Enterococcus faecium]|uniref:hypothetical protein n=1 Tax=Enterococcus faecium TaxID=1352 RepID=UPI000764444B|nr:hypothetical protein [Enterococcus faecium]KWY08136.1 hypothetical protein AS227_10415 [Enterococcus faecium]WGG88126.1 hypothetical protein P8R96_05030 [Enterococcus faecium]
MDPIERLNSLSEEVTQTFHSDFVFLIDAEKIQHFPARNWTHNQIIEELKKRFDHSLMVKPWHEHEVIYSPELPVFALIPKK